MKESNLSFKNIFKRETKLATYIILCVTVVVISSSYALFFQVNQNSKNQEVVAGDLVFTYENGETITGTGNEICFEPMTYEESTLFVSECGYRFSARNTGSLKASYTIKLVAKEENEVELSKLKVVLKKQNMETLEVVSGYPKLVSELENGVLIEEEVDPNSNIVYSVQIFLEEDLYEDSDPNKKVMFEIVGSGLVHEEQSVNTDSTIATNYITNLAKTSEELLYDETADNNLRYVGANPNNYVTFNNELWRIIGVMNNIDDGTGKKESRIKLIRNEPIGNYSWDSSPSSINEGYGINEWGVSDAKVLLNVFYYNSQSDQNCFIATGDQTASCSFTSNGLSSVQNFIGNAVWNTGSNGSIDYLTILTSQSYEYERSSNSGKICPDGPDCNDTVSRTTTWSGVVGLMYPSDYGFATSGSATISREQCLNTPLYNWRANECKTNDWLLLSGVQQWFLTPIARSNHAASSFIIGTSGGLSYGVASDSISLRPTLYLKSEVKIVDGDGSSNNPFLLSL